MSLQDCQLAIEGYETKRREEFELLAKMLGAEIKEQKPDMTTEQIEALNARAAEVWSKKLQATA